MGHSVLRQRHLYVSHLADKIAVIWQKSNSEVLGYVRARMLFAVLRATNLCIRGSRMKWAIPLNNCTPLLMTKNVVQRGSNGNVLGGYVLLQ